MLEIQIFYRNVYNKYIYRYKILYILIHLYIICGWSRFTNVNSSFPPVLLSSSKSTIDYKLRTSLSCDYVSTVVLVETQVPSPVGNIIIKT